MLIYQPDLFFDFRAEGGGIGARLEITNGLLIRTHETPIGSGPAGACGQPRRTSVPAG